MSDGSPGQQCGIGSNHTGATAALFAALRFGAGTPLAIGRRHLGAARTGAYISVAPFFGILLAVFMGDEFTLPPVTVGALMAFGVWLHLSEKRRHEHVREIMAHEHEHTHDERHQHAHEPCIEVLEPHTHAHAHKPLRHTHKHFPDIHHRHVH